MDGTHHHRSSVSVQRLDDSARESPLDAALSRHLPRLISVLGPDASIRCQTGRADVSGYDPETRIGRSLFEFAHPDDRLSADAWWRRVLETPPGAFSIPLEIRQRRADGTWRWVRLQAANLLGEPEVAGIVVEEEDARPAAGRADHETRERLRLAAEAVPMGFLDYDVAAGRIEYSPDCYRMRGRDPVPGAVAASDVDDIHPEDRALASEDLERLVEGPADTADAEFRLATASGGWLWVQRHARVTARDSHGRASRVAGALIDIDARKRVERELNLGAERSRLLAEALGGIVYERDARTGIFTASAGLADVLGLPPGNVSLTTEELLERVHPEDVLTLRADLRDVAQRIVSNHYRIRHADGHYVDLFVRAVRQLDVAGSLVRVIGCAIDMSRLQRVERLLRESEALARVGSWELDVATGELVFSTQAYAVLGANLDQFVPRLPALLDLFAPDSAPIVRSAIERAIATGEGYELDVEVAAPDGARRWVRTSGRVEVAGGRAVRLYGAFKDIDQAKRGELALQEQSDWLRLALDAAQLIAWRWYPKDDRLVVEYRSPAFDTAIPIGTTSADDIRTVHPDDRALVRQALETTVSTGRPADLEVRAFDTSGRIRWVRSRMIRATSDDGFVAIGTTYEVTSRRHAEDALRLSEAMLRSVAENSPDMISIIDRDLRLRFINRALRGVPPAQILGRSVLEYAENEAEIAEAKLRQVLATGRPARLESHYLHRDGTEALFEHRIGPVREEGRITGAIIYSTDITERRQLEREILEISAREQRRIGSDLHDGLGQELTGISLMLRGVASSVSRGTPLRPTDLQELMTLVSGAIETTRTLARGLSPVALEGGGLIEALRALAARAREMYGLDVRFRSRVSPRVTLEPAATGHLYRIAQESLTNAARHARATSVVVQLYVRGSRVSLSVTDDGQGLVTGTATGMGLKIMRYRAHMLGGELSIASGANGRGVRVACTLLQPEPGAATTDGREPRRA